jgi:hypothetical protein
MRVADRHGADPANTHRHGELAMFTPQPDDTHVLSPRHSRVPTIVVTIRLDGDGYRCIAWDTEDSRIIARSDWTYPTHAGASNIAHGMLDALAQVDALRIQGLKYRYQREHNPGA